MNKLLTEEDEKLYWAECTTLDLKSFAALADKNRLQILQKLAEKPSYPSEIARELKVSKQKAHYHFKKLEEAGVIEKSESKNIHGGEADFYTPKTKALGLSLSKGEFSGYRSRKENVERFLSNFIEENKFKGHIVPGSPEPHGEDRAEANDGHLAAEIAVKIAQYAEVPSGSTVLDTDIVRDNHQNKNLILLGGVLTNVLTKQINSKLPAKFNLDAVPYRELEAQKTYNGEEIGMVAKIPNPENSENSVITIAGIRGRGTVAAVKAFCNLEEILDKENLENNEFYVIVEGRDIDGDGRVEDFEILESSNTGQVSQE